jgi:hypothetical protein
MATGDPAFREIQLELEPRNESYLCFIASRKSGGQNGSISGTVTVSDE